MAHHLEHLIQQLRDRVARMTSYVQQAVDQATEALFTLDVSLAREVMNSDDRIDAEEVEIEKQAIGLLALHQPAAADLRFITSVIKVNNDFERIGDCAVNVAQRVPALAKDRAYRVPADLRVMCNSIGSTLRDTIRALNLGDVVLAQQIAHGDDIADALYGQIIEQSLHLIEADAKVARDHVSSVMIAKNFERIGDHCTNIAEDVIYISSGEIIRHQHRREH